MIKLNRIEKIMYLNLCSLLSFFIFTSALAQTPSGKITEITDLGKTPPPGKYSILGFVNKIYECPPCPPRAQCKPCMEPNFIFSTIKKNLKGYHELTSEDLIIYFSKGKPEDFKLKVGGKYLISIEYSTEKTSLSPKIISSEPRDTKILKK